MTAAEIREIMEELSWDWEIVGIRTQEDEFELGEISHCSHIWVDGEDTGDELSGICATTAAGIRMHLDGTYYGDHAAIIAGNRYEYGEDINEVIIQDAVVIKIIK